MRIFIAFIIICFWPMVACSSSLSFIGLKDDNWMIYQLPLNGSERRPRAVAEISNPRSFSRLPGKSWLAYIGSDGALWVYNENTRSKRLLQKPDDKSRYTQLRFGADTLLWAVRLSEGSSRQTQLVGIDIESGSFQTVVAKRGSQFDPFWHEPYVYYSSAHCVDDCDPMIWELWRKDIRTGRQEQITLGRTVSRGPVVSGEFVYFTSNRDHFYHIWKMKPVPGDKPVQLTHGRVTDTELAASSDGMLYFLRKTQTDTTIMALNPESGSITPIVLPGWISDVRGLEVYP